MSVTVTDNSLFQDYPHDHKFHNRIYKYLSGVMLRPLGVLNIIYFQNLQKKIVFRESCVLCSVTDETVPIIRGGGGLLDNNCFVVV